MSDQPERHTYAEIARKYNHAVAISLADKDAIAVNARIAELEAERNNLRRLLGLFYNRYENGVTCYETDDGQIIEGQGIGNAVSLSSSEDAEILAALEGEA